MQDHTPTFPENITEYAPWVAKYGLLQPYGKCQCGCGGDVSLAPYARKEVGWLIGRPKRFIHGHHAALRPLPPIKKRPLEERLWAGVVKGAPDDCWEWKGGSTKGRGNMHNPGGTHLPYRIGYELLYGPIPEGMEVCHKCDNGKCCNPKHWFLGTHADNMEDMAAKGKQPRNKVTKEQVFEIRQRIANGEPRLDIASEYGLRERAIRDIVALRTWRHV